MALLTRRERESIITEALKRAGTGGAPVDLSAIEADIAALETGKVDLAGQLGGSVSSPDVRGLRTTTGPTLLTLGAIADGEYLRRVGATVVGGSPGGGGGLSDGDYGDITVSGGATVFTIDPDVVTFAKMQDIATNKLIGRATAGTGDPELIDLTAAGRALIDDASAADQRTTLGAAAASHTHDWADVTGEPTTLAGYGISDGATDGELAAGLATKADTSHTHAQADVTNLVSDLAAKVPTARTISTTAPLTGGGDLSANRTFAVSNATTTAVGVVELATDGESAANVVVQGNDARMANARTPTVHATSHQNGGSDEISVAGLSGLLADGQTPLAHATSHKSGGSDAIKLDELAAPTDVTTLNASTSAHGLMMKYPGGTTNFLREDGTFASPGAGSTNIKQTEIDFGTTPVSEASFLITDADVSAGSQLIGSVAYEAPTSKDLDELEMDGLDLKFAPGSGAFTLYARGMDGYVADKFKVNYLVG